MCGAYSLVLYRIGAGVEKLRSPSTGRHDGFHLVNESHSISMNLMLCGFPPVPNKWRL